MDDQMRSAAYTLAQRRSASRLGTVSLCDPEGTCAVGLNLNPCESPSRIPSKPKTSGERWPSPSGVRPALRSAQAAPRKPTCAGLECSANGISGFC